MEELLLEIIECAKVEALDELEREWNSLDYLVGSNAEEESAYWEMKAEVHFGL